MGVKLTKDGLVAYRKRQTAAQKNVCPLCEQTMGPDTVVDHDHENGACRAVVCRWCNAVLGKLENWTNRLGRGIDPLKFMRNSADYIERGKTEPGKFIYPTHKTEAEKKLARLAKQRKTRAAARKAAKESE